MNITENEMRGLLAGKCIPGDMKVNEELPAYLVRKFGALQQKLDAADATMRQQDYLIVSYQKTIGQQTGAIEKLAELEKQEPVAYTDNEQIADLHKSTFAEIYPPHDSFKGDPEWFPLYMRPAPAIKSKDNG